LAGRGPHEVEQGAPGGRLAAAGLADQAQRLVRVEVERDVADRVDDADLPPEQAARPDREVLDQMPNADNGRGHDCAPVAAGRSVVSADVGTNTVEASARISRLWKWHAARCPLWSVCTRAGSSSAQTDSASGQRGMNG